ncbi:transcriptional activator NhaR [Methylobacter luteus]|jgi:LysR family transcriptional activator of nhaA|uniref:transcriptional activator NhaR n=1 Tax=Methylobacter luteus TaxID=415 RepID=UPI000417DFA3|nr:transcriptional activator NhaR [Methylobacter luteus]
MINYKHLHYFWMVAKEKSIVRASERLNLTPQTISGQLSLLEETLGVALFDRVGRHLELTDTGHKVLTYADEIFSLGSELENVVHDKPTEPVLTFNVGIADVVPKSIVYRLLEPALRMPTLVRINCRERDLDSLLGDLDLHKLDLVISDNQIPVDTNIRGFSRLLGESTLTFFAAPKLADTFEQAFPNCLDNAPLLLPGIASGIRTQLQQWFDRRHIHPRVIGEFDDSALMEKFGQAGIGIFAVPTAIKAEIEDKCEVISIGEAEDLTVQFYAISMLRKVSHPAVTAITAKAGEWLSRNKANS